MEIFLGSGSETQARLRLRKKVAKAQRKNREAFAVHDPLLDAAEHLYDALFSTYEDGENVYLPAGDLALSQKKNCKGSVIIPMESHQRKQNLTVWCSRFEMRSKNSYTLHFSILPCNIPKRPWNLIFLHSTELDRRTKTLFLCELAK